MNDTHVVDTDLSVISQKYKKEADYWLKKLDGLDAGGFPFMERVGEQRFTETTFTLPAELSARLLNTAGNSDIRLHMILVTGLAILLHKYRPFKSDDISIGMPVYKQEQEGRFVNTVLALRNTVKEENSFKDLLLQFRQTITEAVEHQNYPVEILLKQLDLSPAKEKFPLFDTALLLENIHNREYLQHVNPNMVFMLNHEKDTITGTVTYNENRYTERTINQIIGHFTHLLQQASGDLDTRINDLTVLAEDGLKQLLQNFNRCLDDAKHESEFAHESTISQLFEDQVAKTPDAPAVVFEDDQLTYAQLNERADVAAQILVNKGVTPDTLVALMVEPSLETMVGILGIIKAGGAYLPIHHDTPTERLSVMLKDSGVYLLLTKNDLFKMHSYSTLQGLTRQEMTTFRTKPRPQITDFDSLSMPDRSLVNYEKYNRYIGHNLISNNLSLQATRGCPFKCAYCHKIWPKTHMVRSAEHVFDEIRFNNKLGIRRFSFVDDIFNFNRKNTIRFFRMIIDSDLDIDLFYHMRGDILTEDYIDLMVKAGLKRLALALETGCPRLQKKIGKNLNIEKLRHNMNYIATKYPQIILELYTMHGFPSETEEDAQMTMDFIKGIKWLHFPYIFILHIYPNTEMEKLALDSGIPPEAIDRSMNLAYHELPDTLPFDKSFTIKYQAEFLNEYFLLKERLVDVLPKQMEVLTESEIIQKYNSYLPADIDIRTFDDLLEFFNISRDELPVKECMEESRVYVPDLNTRLKNAYPAVEPEEGALRVLLLDLSQYFSQSDDQLGDLVEPPLGLMYLMTHLNNTFKEKIDGRIAKSMIDFDSFGEFRELLEKFKPQVIGIRTLSFYKDFFHQCVNKIREWGIEAPILTGGPYATSSYHTILQDPAVDLVVMGEGELTLEELIRRMMENGGQLPAEEELKEIEGIAFIPESQKTPWNHAREIITLDDLQPTARRATGPRHAGLGKATGGTSVQPHNLVYNIFTSGSTGRPKGVMLEHRNLSRLVYGLKKRIYDRYDGPLNIGLVASYIFDASIKQIFAALLGGHALHIVPENMRVDGAALFKFLKEHEIHVSDGTPTLIRLLLETLKDPDLDENDISGLQLKHLVIGGEALYRDILHDFLKQLGTVGKELQISNVYGPTECTVDSTSYHLDINSLEKENHNEIPIGKPFPLDRLHVLDKTGRVLPVGVPGELCIGGPKVARGYLNRPEMTAEKFMPPAALTQGAPKGGPLWKPDASMLGTVYRTGDLVCWLPDGNIRFMGRVDHQVKIRGFRIELEEIEQRLSALTEVKEAAVAVKTDAHANEHLCAYFVPHKTETHKDQPYNISHLRRLLSYYLPPYMIPAHFVQMDSLPMTGGGKIDRQALPDPGDSASHLLAPPRNPKEEKLVQVLKKVLGRENVGIYENIFTIGADSIKTIQIASNMKKEGYRLEMMDIFESPTAAQLAEKVKDFQPQTAQTPVTGEVPLTPVQEEFFSIYTIDRHHANHSVMFFSPEPLNPDALKSTVIALQEHHDALRMTYDIREDAVTQTNHGTDYPVWFEVYDYRGSSYEEAAKLMERECNVIQASIDLQKGPIMKTALFRLDDGDRVLLAVHHLVIDGVSWRILFEDIGVLYRHFHNGASGKPDLHPKSDSFKLWGEKLRTHANSPRFLEEKKYWAEVEEQPAGTIARDFDEPVVYIKDLENRGFVLEEEETRRLLTEVNTFYSTETYDLLLIALAEAFKRAGACDRLLVALEGHGRENIIENTDVNRTVGWFTSIYPVVLDVSGQMETVRRVKVLKDTLRRIPNKGIGFGILKYLTSEENKADFRIKLEPQVGFNYLGQFDTDVQQTSFAMARETAGKTHSPESIRKYDLTVTGIVGYGRLSLSIGYSRKQYKAETIDRLLEFYKEELLKLINY